MRNGLRRTCGATTVDTRRLVPWLCLGPRCTAVCLSYAMLLFHQGFDFLHEERHGGQQLLQALTAVEINLKGLEASLVPKAAHVLSHLRRGPLPHRPFACCGSVVCAPRDLAKIHPEAHAGSGDVLPSQLSTGLAQIRLALAQ